MAIIKDISANTTAVTLNQRRRVTSINAIDKAKTAPNTTAITAHAVAVILWDKPFHQRTINNSGSTSILSVICKLA